MGIPAMIATFFPNSSVLIKDQSAYGLIVIQGHGSIGNYLAESPTQIRFNEQTSDEFFISIQAANSGVLVVNNSLTEPMVMLKHFGPDNVFIK